MVDFKYGKGITVSAEENPQMMLYAVGAIAEYGIVFPVERVILHIVQPRTKNFSRWEISAGQLQTWSEQTVKPAAELAWKARGILGRAPGVMTASVLPREPAGSGWRKTWRPCRNIRTQLQGR